MILAQMKEEEETCTMIGITTIMTAVPTKS